MTRRCLYITALLIAGCQGNPDGYDPVEFPETQGTRTIKPGETTRSLQNLRYFAEGGNSSDGDPQVIDTCTLATNADAVALLEFSTGITEIVPIEDDCSGPYASSAFVYKVDTLAVAAGVEMPQRFELVSVGIDVMTERFPGDLILAQIIEADGQWFVDTNLIVLLDQDGIGTAETRWQRVYLPESFDMMSAELMHNFAHFAESCPDFVSSIRTDEEVRAYQRDPFTRGCNPIRDLPCDDPDCPEPGR